MLNNWILIAKSDITIIAKEWNTNTYMYTFYNIIMFVRSSFNFNATKIYTSGYFEIGRYLIQKQIKLTARRVNVI